MFLFPLNTWTVSSLTWLIIPGCSYPTGYSEAATVASEKVPKGKRQNQSIIHRAGSVQSLEDKMLFLILLLADPGILDRTICRIAIFLSVFCCFQYFALWTKDCLLLAIYKVPFRIQSKYNLVSLSYI